MLDVAESGLHQRGREGLGPQRGLGGLVDLHGTLLAAGVRQADDAALGDADVIDADLLRLGGGHRVLGSDGEVLRLLLLREFVVLFLERLLDLGHNFWAFDGVQDHAAIEQRLALPEGALQLW